MRGERVLPQLMDLSRGRALQALPKEARLCGKYEERRYGEWPQQAVVARGYSRGPAFLHHNNRRMRLIAGTKLLFACHVLSPYSLLE